MGFRENIGFIKKEKLRLDKNVEIYSTWEAMFGMISPCWVFSKCYLGIFKILRFWLNMAGQRSNYVTI